MDICEIEIPVNPFHRDPVPFFLTLKKGHWISWIDTSLVVNCVAQVPVSCVNLTLGDLSLLNKVARNCFELNRLITLRDGVSAGVISCRG
jgi:hypothetical protein